MDETEAGELNRRSWHSQWPCKWIQGNSLEVNCRGRIYSSWQMTEESRMAPRYLAWETAKEVVMAGAVTVIEIGNTGATSPEILTKQKTVWLSVKKKPPNI